jgi:pimeloyl-ACP methyl ester carboxylesterase
MRVLGRSGHYRGIVCAPRGRPPLRAGFRSGSVGATAVGRGGGSGRRSRRCCPPVRCVELFVDTVGSPTDIPLLLIGTTVATWGDELVERLTGRFVIRYDLRDTGRSATVDPDSPGYTLRDLVTDAVGVLDRLGIARAHVVGIATGGFIAQLLALDHPSRVASLVLVGTRPVAPGPVDDDLREHSPAIMAYFGSAPPVDWTDRTSILDGVVAAARVFSGSPQFDAAEEQVGDVVSAGDRWVPPSRRLSPPN